VDGRARVARVVGLLVDTSEEHGVVAGLVSESCAHASAVKTLMYCDQPG
jgi:hypothetical protein